MRLDLTGGLPLSREEVLVRPSDDPEYREGVNIWFDDDLGRFSLPRIGVEVVSGSWARRGIQANIAFPDGRVLIGSCEGDAIGPYDEEGRPAVIGAGPIQFHCMQLFERRTMSYRGAAVDTTIDQQLAGVPWPEARVEVAIDVDMTMVVPPWIQGEMSERASELLQGAEEGLFMGGKRYEQLFGAIGTLRVDEEEWEFNATGLRIHRQGVPDTSEFGGTVGSRRYFPVDEPSATSRFLTTRTVRRQEGFVFDGQQMMPATLIQAPWLGTFIPHGGDVSLSLECELGNVSIRGETTNSTAIPGREQMANIAAMTAGTARHDLFLHQGGARYTWDNETTHGMIERSLPMDQVVVAPA
jgi:hypothetical protein